MIAIRAALFAAYFYVLTTCLAVAGIGLRLVAGHRAADLARYWVRLVFAGLARLCNIHVVVTGRENLPTSGAALLASQHQSAGDALLWFTLLPRPTYVMKQELTRIPLFGPLLIRAGMIPVDRTAGPHALRGLLAEAVAARDAPYQIVIFPEGTRVAPGGRVKLQPGIAAIAGRLGLPVIPVATDSGLCWGRGLLGKKPGTIHVCVGTPIPAGTPRKALLGAIELHWREAEARGFASVDKSVGNMPPSPIDTFR
jgi:1-acyl-sn-glycerol-3-phosphate acyltransferase